MIRAFVILLISISSGYADPLRVAVASSMRPAMEEIVASFNEQSDCDVQVVYGSSGKLTAQIMNGAPFDMFFSADMMYPENLAAAEETVRSIRPYALGHLALWIPGSGAVNLNMLTNDSIRHIAVANPSVAPYGEAAIQTLSNAGLLEAVKEKLVYAENVLQAAHFVKSGAADAGFVALSVVKLGTDCQRQGWSVIDEKLHEPLKHGFVAFQSMAKRKCIEAFGSFIGEEQAAEILDKHGMSALVDIRGE